MNQARQNPYPEPVPIWMVGEQRRRVLDLGSGRGAFAQMLHDSGHEVFAVDRNPSRVAQVAERLGTAVHVAGQVESLPFLSCHFDVATSAQTLHRFAPGLALTEIARVLVPGGHLAISYRTRDDTVPWVKRLMALVQAADPSAMRSEIEEDSINAVAESAYFGPLERRNFRTWVPITRPGLIAMVDRRPAVSQLEPEVRSTLLKQVGDLYDSSARAPEPLLLPYQASCWRAEVNHSQLVLDDLDDAALAMRW